MNTRKISSVALLALAALVALAPGASAAGPGSTYVSLYDDYNGLATVQVTNNAYDSGTITTTLPQANWGLYYGPTDLDGRYYYPQLFPYQIAPRETIWYVVRRYPGAAAGDFVVAINGQEAGRVSLPGMPGASAPAYSTSPRQVAIRVALGRKAPKTITLSNTGDAAGIPSPIALGEGTPSSFRIKASTCGPVAPDGTSVTPNILYPAAPDPRGRVGRNSCTIKVTYTAETSETVTGTLNAGGLSIPLKGALPK